MSKMLALCAAVLLLTGCAEQVPEPAPASVYYELARTVGYFSAASDDQLDDFADEACDAMAPGDHDSSWVLGVKLLTESGLTGEEAGGFLVYAAAYRCPEMLARFPSAQK